MTGALRQLSGVERLWLAADRIARPFVNQMVLEAAPGSSSGSVDPGALGDVLEQLASDHPGLSLRLAGTLGRSRWSTGGAPPSVRVITDSSWDGCSDEGAAFLEEPLDPRAGPCFEVLVVRGQPERLVLRSHHAAMDGRGTLLLAASVFALLRGEEPEPTVAGPLTDFDLASRSGRPAEALPSHDLPPLLRGRGEQRAGLTWARTGLAPLGSSPLAVVLAVLAARSPEPCRIDIPIDMRRHADDLRSTANLTGLLRLPIQPGDGPEAIAARLKALVAERAEADFVLGAQRVRSLPLWLLGWAGGRAASKAQSRGLFETSGTVSNLGLLDPSLFSAPGFEAGRIFFVPPGSPGLPLFMTLTGGPEGLELCASVPRRLATPSELRLQLEEVATAVGAMG